jgi:hypothetical protein
MDIYHGEILGGQSPNDLPVVHLSVHPSAWASAPPSIAMTSVSASSAAPMTVTSTAPAPPPTQASYGAASYFSTPPAPPSTPQPQTGSTPRPAQPGASVPPSAALPAPTSVPGLAPISVGYINYIAYQHLSAASILRSGRIVDDPPPAGLIESKNLAKQLMTQWGYTWPSVFDEEYPPAQEESAGIKYEHVKIEWVSQFPRYIIFLPVLQWRGLSPAC